MKNVMTIGIEDGVTGEVSIRDVVLPVEKAFTNPRQPQFICVLPPGCKAHILGIEQKEDYEV